MQLKQNKLQDQHSACIIKLHELFPNYLIKRHLAAYVVDDVSMEYINFPNAYTGVKILNKSFQKCGIFQVCGNYSNKPKFNSRQIKRRLPSGNACYHSV